MRFAERAIEAQPLDYARVVVKDTLTTFGWTRENVNNSIGNLEGSGSKFRFEPTVQKVPGWITSNPVNARAARDFGGADYGRPSVVQPWARFLWAYQKVVYLRGTFLLLFVLAGAVGVALGVHPKTRVPGTGWGAPKASCAASSPSCPPGSSASWPGWPPPASTPSPTSPRCSPSPASPSTAPPAIPGNRIGQVIRIGRHLAPRNSLKGFRSPQPALPLIPARFFFGPVVNLVLPIAAHELDYRYAISAVPFACLALGLACIRRPAPAAEVSPAD
jgi:hypothetical protein